MVARGRGSRNRKGRPTWKTPPTSTHPNETMQAKGSKAPQDTKVYPLCRRRPRKRRQPYPYPREPIQELYQNTKYLQKKSTSNKKNEPLCHPSTTSFTTNQRVLCPIYNRQGGVRRSRQPTNQVPSNAIYQSYTKAHPINYTK